MVIQRMDTTGRTVLKKSDCGNYGAGATGASAFNKDELTDILQFGAGDLFKEDEDEDDLQVDIDDILNRAETAETEEAAATGAANELLSQFKIVSFDNLEEDEIKSNQKNDEKVKNWDDIIPQ